MAPVAQEAEIIELSLEQLEGIQGGGNGIANIFLLKAVTFCISLNFSIFTLLIMILREPIALESIHWHLI